MLVKFELLIVYNVNTLNFIWLIKGFVYTSFVVMEHTSYRHLDSYFVSIRPRACFFPLFSFLPLWLHYNLNPLCVQY